MTTEQLLEGIKSVTLKRVLTIILIIGPFLLPITNGVWEFGVDKKWWGSGKGQTEQINLVLARKNIMTAPVHSFKVIDEENDKLELVVYPTGDVLVKRHIKTIDGEHHRMTWLPRQSPEKILESAWLKSNIAHAGIKQTIKDYEDMPIQWVDDYHVLIRRTYKNCYKILLIDVTTGEIIEIKETDCVK